MTTKVEKDLDSRNTKGLNVAAHSNEGRNLNNTAHEKNPNNPINAAKKDCQEMGKIFAVNTNELAGNLQSMILFYYQDVRNQAQQSFYCALEAAVLSTGKVKKIGRV